MLRNVKGMVSMSLEEKFQGGSWGFLFVFRALFVVLYGVSGAVTRVLW